MDDTAVHQALREALANCLVNADYYGRQGLVIVKKRDIITMSNPGSFRIEVDAAKSGGISDPRNATILKMFNLIDIGERAGSGIPNIFRVWREQGWHEPTITERTEPERTVLSLPFSLGLSSDKKVAIKSSDKTARFISASQKASIMEYLTDHVCAKCSEISSMLGTKDARTRRILGEMIEEGTVCAEGANRNRVYKLKA